MKKKIRSIYSIKPLDKALDEATLKQLAMDHIKNDIGSQIVREFEPHIKKDISTQRYEHGRYYIDVEVEDL